MVVYKHQLIDFLLKARTKTYAGNQGETKPLLKGSKQFEYPSGDLLYRDIYNQGNKKFIGLETLYFKSKPVWSMSYYGNFKKMSGQETNDILKKALIDKKDEVRLWNKVTYKIGKYTYVNEGNGNVDEFDGVEQIIKQGEKIYFFYYAAAFIG